MFFCRPFRYVTSVHPFHGRTCQKLGRCHCEIEMDCYAKMLRWLFTQLNRFWKSTYNCLLAGCIRGSFSEVKEQSFLWTILFLTGILSRYVHVVRRKKANNTYPGHGTSENVCRMFRSQHFILHINFLHFSPMALVCSIFSLALLTSLIYNETSYPVRCVANNIDM